MKRRLSILSLVVAVSMLIGIIPVFAATETISATKEDLEKGIFGVTYTDNSANVYKVLVTKGEEKVSYPFFANGKTEYFPLQFGNGTYKVALLKNVGGKKYAYVEQKSITINLKDSNVVYLNSIQNIKWNSDDDAIKFALNQTKDIKTAQAAFEVFYKYLVENVVYDYDKAKTVQKDYVPSLAKTFVDSKGICYDYSCMLASFMRSKGFPTRLVKGYTTELEGYHAWNEVLIEGKWMIVDTTVDASRKDFTIKFKPADKYKKVFDY